MKKRCQKSFVDKQAGFLAVIAVLMIVVIGLLGLTVSSMYIGSANSTINFQLAENALFAAESGLEDSIHQLMTPLLSKRQACSGLSISYSLDKSAYSVTSIGPFYVNAPTTLSSSITYAVTTIPVVSTSGYQSSGRIMIDKEVINYSSINSTNFLGVTRGVDDTVATAHVSGTKVGQYQCNLSAQGGAPNLAAATSMDIPEGRRLLQDKIQLQEAWAIGTNRGINFTLIRWNNPIEKSWNNASSLGTFTLTGIAMNSYVDGWAVGNSTTFLRWNGTNWSSFASGLGGSIYSSVYCSSGNDCHVVGASRRFGRWNGSSWSLNAATGSLANTQLLSVHCNSPTNCWAVGSSAGGGKFYNGTGTPIAWVGIDESFLLSYPYDSVFCNADNDCWAVGTGSSFARKTTSNWTNFATGLPASNYNSIFCNSSSDCWVVGNATNNQDLIAHWNGSSWIRDNSNPTPVANLNAVTCAQTNDCWAVGVTAIGINPVFVHWDGNNWIQFASNGLPASTLRNIAIISPHGQPQNAWSENFN
jgi:Tfp pilus assembly protein PilX